MTAFTSINMLILLKRHLGQLAKETYSLPYLSPIGD